MNLSVCCTAGSQPSGGILELMFICMNSAFSLDPFEQYFDEDDLPSLLPQV